MRRFKGFRFLSLLLCVAMISSEPVMAQAAEIVTDNTAIEASEVQPESEEVVVNDSESEEISEEISEVVKESASEEISEEISELQEDSEDISDDVYSNKIEMADAMEQFSELTAGEDFDADSVFTLCESEEEAEKIAEAYGLELEDFGYGVATFKTTMIIGGVQAAVRESLDLTSSLPVLYPNIYRELCTEVPDDPNNEVGEDSFLNQSVDSFQWYHNQLNMYSVWNEQVKANDVTVAIVDSGIIQNHEDFDDTKIEPLTVIGDSPTMGDTTDTLGHGTYLAGIIAAKGNNKVGGRGIADGVTIQSIKATDSNNKLSDDNIIKGINLAIEKEADVINLSMASPAYNPAYIKAISDARAEGIVIVAAAGNNNSSYPEYPASFNGVISVSSVTSKNAKSPFSSYGSKIDIAAPGGDVTYSINNKNDYEKTERIFSTGLGSDTYSGGYGTSQASAMVSSVAALVIANNQEVKDSTGILKSQKVEDILTSTAKKIGDKNNYGAGCVDAAKALGIDSTIAQPVFSIPTGTVITAEQMIEITTDKISQYNKIYYTLNGSTPTNKKGTLYNGEFKIGGKGKVTLKAVNYWGNKVSKMTTVTYTVDDSVVSSIEVKSDNGFNNVALGKTIKLTAEVLPSYAKNKTVEWSSSDESIATVSSNGTVKGLAEGDTSIIAVSKENEGVYGVFNIHVTPAATAINADPSLSNFIVCVGSVMSLDSCATDGVIAVIHPKSASQNFTFSSSDKKVATVDADGNVTGVKLGDFTITVTTADGTKLTDKIKGKVVPAITSIQVAGKDGALYAAEGGKFTPVVKYNGEDKTLPSTDFTWTYVDDNDAVKEFNVNTGVMTLRKVETAQKSTTNFEPYKITVTATSKKNTELKDSFDVYVRPRATSLNLKTPISGEKTVKVYASIGDKIKFDDVLSSGVKPSNASRLGRFESSNTEVLAFNETGINEGYFTVFAFGKTEITKTAADGSGLTGKIAVEVVQGAKGAAITSSSPYFNLAFGGADSKATKLKLSVKTFPAESTYSGVKWSSSDKTLLTVSSSGEVAVAKDATLPAGVDFKDVIIKAEIKCNGITNKYSYAPTAVVRVFRTRTEAVILRDVSNQVLASTIEMKAGDVKKIVASSVPEAACQDNYAFSSSNTSVAKVLEDGTVIAVGSGKADITVKSSDNSGKYAKVKVLVVTPITKIELSTKNDVECLGAGKSLAIKATVNSTATNKKLIWSLSSGADYATISSTGTLKANKSITSKQIVTVVAASAENASVKQSISINLYPITKAITIAKENKSVVLIAPQYSGNNVVEVPYEITEFASPYLSVKSSKESVATAVIKDGKVRITAKAVGKASITIAALDGSGKSARIDVNSVVPVNTLSIGSKSNSEAIIAGKSLQLIANVNKYATIKKVEWSIISGEATISSSGLLKINKGVTSGEVHVKAKSTDGSDIEDVKAFRITQPAAKITLADKDGNTKITLTQNPNGSLFDTTELVAAMFDKDKNPVDSSVYDKLVYTSSNTAIARVMVEDGKVYVKTGYKTGNAKITVSTLDGSGKKASVSVKVNALVSQLAITSKNGYRYVAGTKKLQLVATTNSNATNKKVEWSFVGDSYGAILSKSGQLTTPDVSTPKKIVVIAKALDESAVLNSIEIMIYPKTTKIMLSGTKPMIIGQSQELSTEIIGSDSSLGISQLIVKSSNTSAVKVMKDNGKIKIVAVGKGNAVITATSTDGTNVKGSFSVSVKEK